MPNLPDDKLQYLAALCGSMALLVVVTLFLMGGTPQGVVAQTTVSPASQTATLGCYFVVSCSAGAAYLYADTPIDYGTQTTVHGAPATSGTFCWLWGGDIQQGQDITYGKGQAFAYTSGPLTESTTFYVQCNHGGDLSQVVSTNVTVNAQVIYGCTDPNANNYNSSATNNDGSCSYTAAPVYGCTDPNANNYNPSATVNDGSCSYTAAPVYGCTDPNANNYNPSATVNDGSCRYSSPPPPPPSVTLSANPSTVDHGGSSILEWHAIGGGGYDACYLGGGQWWGGVPVGIDGSVATGPLNSTTGYWYSCHDTYYGWQTVYTTVNVNPYPPSGVSISASPSTVEYNAPSTVSWNSSNVTSCAVSGPGVSSNSTSGSQNTGSLTSNATYTANCTGIDGNNYNDSTTVAVGQPPPPPDITIDPNDSIISGQDVVLSWQCPAGATSSYGSFDTGGATSGSITINPTDTTQYTVTCVFPHTNTSAAITVTVLQPQLSITATPARVQKGQKTTLTWSATHVTPNSCTVSAAKSGALAHSDSGSLTPTVGNAETYTLTCGTPAGSVSKSVSVTLIPTFQEI